MMSKNRKFFLKMIKNFMAYCEILLGVNANMSGIRLCEADMNLYL